ncbi:hypothetical protein V6N13_009888 [Hibiscus sabdariffa]
MSWSLESSIVGGTLFEFEVGSFPQSGHGNKKDQKLSFHHVDRVNILVAINIVFEGASHALLVRAWGGDQLQVINKAHGFRSISLTWKGTRTDCEAGVPPITDYGFAVCFWKWWKMNWGQFTNTGHIVESIWWVVPLKSMAPCLDPIELCWDPPHVGTVKFFVVGAASLDKAVCGGTI